LNSSVTRAALVTYEEQEQVEKAEEEARYKSKGRKIEVCPVFY
jgi:hypothetical protein